MREQWLIWCGTNAEQDALASALGDDCVSIDGRTPLEEKIRLEECWRTGQVPVLITKPDVMGWGMNWQHCARMAFVGLSDSFESYFQCLRRCWRYGQTREVVAHIVLTEPEEPIYANVLRKEREATAMSEALVRHVSEFERAEIASITARDDYRAEAEMRLPRWLKNGH